MTTRKRGFELIADDMIDYVERTGRDAFYELASTDGPLYIVLSARTIDNKPHRRLTISRMWPAEPTVEDQRIVRRVFNIPAEAPAEPDTHAVAGANICFIHFDYRCQPEAQP